jgi:hypothetical protein
MVMKYRHLALVGVSAAAAAAAFVAVPAGASTTVSTAASGSTTAASCDRGPWAPRVQGAPAHFDAGDRGGDYLWHDTSGFHLRVTHKGDNRAVYTGVIHSPTAMRMDRVRLEKGDVAKLSSDHKSIVFTFADYGHIDGIDFHTDCAASLTVTNLNVGNSTLPANRVFLGHLKVHPAQVPFTLHRLPG